jgi:uncharacterized repeat protein (TIGR03806 family)
MRALSPWSPVLVLGIVVGGSTLAAACGDDDVPGATPDGDGGADGTANDGNVPPIDSPFGLDTRPPNPTCQAPGRAPSTAAVKWVEVFAGLGWQQPMRLNQIPGDDSRFFLAQRNGKIVSFASNATAGPVKEVFNLDTGKAPLDILQQGGEGGLLGMAFHPKFAQNGRLYLSYTKHSSTAVDMRSTVTRIVSTDNGATFGQETDVIAPFEQPATNHNGGGIGFGRDGFLYIGFGDGGGGGDTFNHGQDTTTFFSKMLRIDVDSASPYAVPSDNPFKNGGGAPEIYAYGFRNPFRWSHDKDTGELWVGDVGQNLWEEIDRVKLGGNYGWSKKEGTHCYNAGPGFTPGASPCPIPGLIDPVFEYDHVVDGTAKSITGGFVYRGKAIPSFVGTYVYGDFVIGKIWGLTIDPSTQLPTVTQLNTSGPLGGWSSFAEDNAGELYALDLNGNHIYKMVPNPAASGDAGAEAGSSKPPPADKLSQTGCVDPKDPTRPASGLVPYGVNSPLWSDGAEKERFMALPDGAKIKVGADGDWDLPIGTVLMKTFKLGGNLIETRLFVRHEDGGWAGYTYEWNDQHTDATLLPSSKTRQVGAQSWYYPSRSECSTCHSGAAGRTLGLEDGQLNGVFVYYTTNRRSNQIATLEHIGMFETPHPAPEATGKYPTPTVVADGTVEARARSYLHANCSFCHRPQGIGGGSMDFRFATPTGDIKACDAIPASGDLGIAGLKIIKPGDPSKSAISVRTHALDAKRMPPLATTVVDNDGVKVLDDFINSIATCPAPTTIQDAGGQ